MPASLTRRAFLSAATVAAAQTTRKPNLVLILADDLGYSDIGCFGGEIATPNLDSLARGGLRFTQMYSTARCMPSRGALLTGFYAQQSGLQQSVTARPARWVRFLPQYLGEQGYRCYHSGKWHISASLPLRDTGFHHSYRLNDQDRFFSPRNHALDDQPLPPVQRGSGYYATRVIADHALQWLRGHRQDHSDTPFFLYLAFTSPHFPLQALPEDIAKYRGKYAMGWDRLREQRWRKARELGLVQAHPSKLEPDVWPPWNTPQQELERQVGSKEVARAVPWESLTAEQKEFQAGKMEIHAAMVDRMDQEIGRVIEQLKAMNAMRDTLIVFLSDNGASAEQLIRADGHDPAAEPGSAGSHLGLGPGWSSAANSPFRYHKSWVHEGGVSSPCVVHWPAGISQQGKLRHTPCHFIDIVPTLADLAGNDRPHAKEKAPPLPGRSLRSALARDVNIPRDYVFFHHLDNKALRQGDWKIVTNGNAPWELFNLRRDRGETTNLAASQPERLKRMASTWESLSREFERQRVNE
jgi:arylsulfatase